MASPEDRDKKRRRMKNRWAKDLRTSKYKPKVVEDKKKGPVKDLSHSDLVRMIQEDNEAEQRLIDEENHRRNMQEFLD
jgi:hypothetical protein